MIKTLVLATGALALVTGGGIMMSHGSHLLTTALPVHTVHIDVGGSLRINLTEDAAQTLNLSMSELQSELNSDGTLAQVAVKHGSTAAELEQTLTNKVDAQIRQGVTSGKVSDAQASRVIPLVGNSIDSFVSGNFNSAQTS
jgi:hypothetical protein